MSTCFLELSGFENKKIWIVITVVHVNIVNVRFTVNENYQY